ncbi:hypothetical protein KEJ15_01035 [Candidatus Bathyarchaeota archaeon]|nr:hypothetical protein [Candidatus Bathyarchaeota archaeon]
MRKKIAVNVQASKIITVNSQYSHQDLKKTAFDTPSCKLPDEKKKEASKPLYLVRYE